MKSRIPFLFYESNRQETGKVQDLNTFHLRHRIIGKDFVSIDLGYLGFDFEVYRA